MITVAQAEWAANSLDCRQGCDSIGGMSFVPRCALALLVIASTAAAAPKPAVVKLTAKQAEPYYASLARGAKLPDNVFRGVLNRLRLNLRSKTPGPGLTALVKRLERVPSPVIGPDRQQQLNFANNQPGALRAIYDEHLLAGQTVDQIRKHPSADLFPGKVPATAKRTTQTFRLNLRALGKVGTGLYVPPGEKVTIQLPTELTELGLKARIGLHSTSLSLAKFRTLKRFPSVSRVFDLQAETTVIASAFGGLLYIEMADPNDPYLNVRKGDMENLVGSYTAPMPEWKDIVITGTVNAPRYVRGETSMRKWRTAIRNHPAPWAELESDKVVFTVPSSMIRDLEEPNRVMAKWDDVMDAMADLSARPRQRPVAMRFMLDAHVNFGAAFAGYPINAPYSWGKAIVTGQPSWGHVHELGHMHQKKDWTYQGTGEVTVNLFSLYALEKTTEGPIERADPARVQGLVNDWFKKPAKDRNWMKGGGAWDKLAFYQLLIPEFGWEPFKDVFRAYRELPLDKKLKADQNRAGDFMARFSKRVGKNLEPYFRVWGVQLNPDYRVQVKDLPVWLPQELPASIQAEARR